MRVRKGGQERFCWRHGTRLGDPLRCLNSEDSNIRTNHARDKPSKAVFFDLVIALPNVRVISDPVLYSCEVRGRKRKRNEGINYWPNHRVILGESQPGDFTGFSINGFEFMAVGEDVEGLGSCGYISEDEEELPSHETKHKQSKTFPMNGGGGGGFR